MNGAGLNLPGKPGLLKLTVLQSRTMTAWLLVAV